MKSLNRQFPVLLVTVLLAACEGAESVATTTVHRDSAGIRISVVPGTFVTAAPQWETGARPHLSIGESADGGASQYFRVSGVRMLPGGRVMFSTDASKQVFVVDSMGDLVESRGRPGRGPFEFLHLQMLKSADTSVFAFYDALQRRVTVLSAPNAEPATFSLVVAGQNSAIPHVRFGDGQLLARRTGPLPAASPKGVVHGMDTLVRVDQQGRTVASFGAHMADDRVLRLNASGGLTGGRPPYRRQLLVDANDSSVVVAATGEWEMWIFGARGGNPHIVRVDRPRRAVDATMRKLYRERVLRDVRDEYGIREWTMLSNDDVFLKELPAFDQLLFDHEGSIWLRESVTLADKDARWVVFDRAGAPIARVALPAALTPFDISSNRIAGVLLDELGREQIQVWALMRR